VLNAVDYSLFCINCLIGVGCTLGSGVFILVGQVAHSMAGPSVVLCLLVAGIASIFAGIFIYSPFWYHCVLSSNLHRRYLKNSINHAFL